MAFASAINQSQSELVVHVAAGKRKLDELEDEILRLLSESTGYVWWEWVVCWLVEEHGKGVENMVWAKTGLDLTRSLQ